MIHKKKEKRRIFCYLKFTVVTTEDDVKQRHVLTIENLNSTVVTTEGFRDVQACFDNMQFKFYCSNN